MKPSSPAPPEQGEPGFGRDEDLERTRDRQRPAEADLDATEEKAGQPPVINYAPDPSKSPRQAPDDDAE